MKAHAAHPHEKPHHPHWPLAALLFLFVFLIGMRSVHAPETWIHLKTGAKILAESKIPRTDPFSSGAAGAAWSTDSWLADVLFAKLEAWGGAPLLVGFKSAVVAAAFALLLPISHGNPILSASLLALGACAGWAGLTETPAVFDLLFFALFLRLLRPRHRFRWTDAAATTALAALWVNLHGPSAILAVWLIGLKVFKASLRTAARERLGYWAMMTGALLVLSWNPHGWSVLGHAFNDVAVLPGDWPTPFLSLYGLFVLAAAAACWQTLQQEFVTTMAVATVVALSLVMPGLRALAALAACPVIALAVGHWMRPREDTWPRVLRWAVGAALLFGVYHSLVTRPLASLRGYGSPALAGAAHFVKANGLRGRLFNEPDAGAELIGLIDAPVFVDNRPGLYTATFRREAAAWPRLFRQLDSIYRFDAAVLLNRRAGAPARVLDEDPAWRLAFADDKALVYVKKTGADAWLLTGQPARKIAPNRLWPSELDAALADKKRAGEVLRELDAWIAQAPDSAQALLWKAYALDRAGLGPKAERLLALVEERPSTRRDAELSAALGFVRENRGETALAVAAYHRATRLARRLGDARVEAEILPRLAGLQRGAGEEAKARESEARAAALLARVAVEE